MQQTILPDYLSTRYEYDRRDALFFALLALMVKRGKTALIPALLRRMEAARGGNVRRFNDFMARLIRAWSVQ